MHTIPSLLQILLCLVSLTTSTPTKLRILGLGDSITYGYASPSGNGYLLQLRQTLQSSGHEIVYAGTVHGKGNMTDDYMAGYPGKTISYIASQAPSSLSQTPTVVLLMAGTNDMNSDPTISTEGDDPQAAAGRLSDLLGNVTNTLPESVVLLAKIPNTADEEQEARTEKFNTLIPGLVEQAKGNGKKVALVDMSVIQANQTVDGVHPDGERYEEMGDIWAKGISDLPAGWIEAAVGPDPVRS